MGKARILSILEILKKTDEEHALTIAEMIGKLRLHGIEAERKAISRDIQALNDSGYSILSAGKREGYYLVEREFEDYELIMMCLAVSRAKFLTEKDSRDIVHKLKAMASPSLEKLIGETAIDGALKTDNTAAKYSIDMIIRAIKENRKLHFKYYEYDVDRKKRLRRNGHVYTVSPFYLAWVAEELFMIANPDSHGHLTHFRVAMLTSTEVSGQYRKKRDEVIELAGDFNLSEYIRKSVNMFTGESVDISLRCHISLLDTVTDKFGRDLWISNTGDEHFSVTIRASDSDGIYQWILGYGEKIVVLSPTHVRDQVRDRLAAAIGQYSD